jgi:hypothetical protein
MRFALFALALAMLGGTPRSASSVAASGPSGPRVISVSPTGTMTAGIGPVKVVFDEAVDPVTVTSTSFTVTRAGPDQLLGTADDVEVYPLSITVANTEVTLDFAGLSLPNDKYRIRVRGTEPTIPSETNHWKLDDASGATAADSAGSLNGTLLGATLPTWNLAGRLGGALEFTASDHRVQLGGADLPQPYTASMWVKRVDSPNEDARLMNSPTASFRLEQYNHTNRVGLTVPQSLDFAYNYTAPVGSWVHLAFVADGLQTALYVNGLFSQNNGGFAMGCPRDYLGSEDFNSMRGLLDEVRLFSRRLSEAEIKSLAGLGGVVRGLTGVPLDGENLGGFPSGNGTAGGDFVSDFTIAHPTPFISFGSPAPGSAVAAPLQVWLASSVILDPATVGPGSIRVVRAGPDGTFGTPDDVVVTPTSIVLDSQVVIRINLPAGLPGDDYRVIVSGTVSEPAGAVNRWTFDEGLGTAANDSAGTDHGTLGAGRGVPVWTTGRLGTGLRFEGYSDRVLVNAAALPVPWSTSVWLRRGVSTAEDGRLMDSLATSLRTEQYNFSGKIGVTVYGAVDSAYAFAAPIGPWTHLTFLGEASGTSLYVNGAFSQKVSTALSLPRIAFGSTDYNSMVGTIDEVRVYDRKLTDAEIGVLATAGGAVRSPSGELLDGEFSGTYPSGNGVPGGDFVLTFHIDEPPGAFTLTTPAGAATGVSTTPTFTWTASANATSYRIQVSQAPDWGPVYVIDQSGIVGTSFTPAAPLADGIRYLWAVTAVNGAGSRMGVGSISSFTTAGTAPPPGAFSLSAPADGASGVSTTPTYSWTPSSNVSNYTLQVSTDPAFGSFVINQANIDSTSYTQVTTLALNTLYYWRVMGVNTGGSTTSGPHSFTTMPGAPGAFSLSTPSAGASNVSTSPSFSWTTSTGAATYTLQVSISPIFSSYVVNQSGIVGTSVSPAVTLATSTVHYWRVIAVNAGGSSTTPSASFTTVPAPPGVFTLSSPSAGQADVSTSPTYSWTASSGAASYTLHVSTDPLFGSFVVNQAGIGGTSATPAGVLAMSTPHYWRVIATNGGGTATAGPASFTTQPPPPGAFALLLPVDGAKQTPLAPTFTWEASSGAATYTLEVALDSLFSAPVLTQSGISGTSVTPAGPLLDAGRIHFWRVSAVNVSGSTPASNGPRSYTTSSDLVVGGGCGLTGWEGLILIAMLRLRRAKARR